MQNSLGEVAGAAGDRASARVMTQERKGVVGVRLQMGERGSGFARGNAHEKDWQRSTSRLGRLC